MRYEVMFKFARKRDAIKSARSWAKAMQFLDIARVHVDLIGEGLSAAKAEGGAA